MPKHLPSNSPMTNTQAHQAIYLDFESEGEKGSGEQPPPVLGGVLVDGCYKPTLLHEDLMEAASVRHWGYAMLNDYLHELQKQAMREERLIVYFSSAEKKIFEDAGIPTSNCGFDLRPFAKRSGLFKTQWREFKNNEKKFCKPLAKTTKKQLQPKAHGLLSLLATSLGLPRPYSYGAGSVGKYIRYFMKQAKTKGCYADWSKGGKTKLTLLKKHNEHDCKSTQYVLEHILNHQ